MATARYSINVRLDFSDETKRNNIYAKIKTALSNAKTTDAWDTGSITKDEYMKADNTQEKV